MYLPFAAAHEAPAYVVLPLYCISNAEKIQVLFAALSRLHKNVTLRSRAQRPYKNKPEQNAAPCQTQRAPLARETLLCALKRAQIRFQGNASPCCGSAALP